MDTQLKRGLLDVCILKILSHGDSYGYQILKDAAPYIEISESTLYPILKRLERSECLAVYSTEHNGRLRKYFKITDAGKQQIDTFLAEWEQVNKVYEFINKEDEHE